MCCIDRLSWQTLSFILNGRCPTPGSAGCHNTATALQVERIGEGWLPALLTPDSAAGLRVIEFFTAHIRNPHTRNAYVEELRQKHANLNGAEHAPVGRAAARW